MPKWLSRADEEAIHETVIEIGGGLHGLREAALLESALARPRTLYACGEVDDFRLAASYAEGIARTIRFLTAISVRPSPLRTTSWPTMAIISIMLGGVAMLK